MKETIMFRLVPTMKCNFRCQYCFLSNSIKEVEQTIFDEHSVNEWIEGINSFSNYNIELYLWGGEPFCIPETYTLLKECTKMEHVIHGIRVDTNVFFAEKIVRECPSNKIKLNCSYHMQYHTLEEEFRKVKLLKDMNMVGMVNFVASPYNIEHLKKDYGMSVHDLIDKFNEIDVFVNVAGDFFYANNENYEKFDEYKKFIQQFTSPLDWSFLRNEKSEPRECTAGQKMFTIEQNGDFVSCMSNKIYGNLFKKTLETDSAPSICKKACKSLVSYPFRCDNEFYSVNSLLAYVERQKEYRLQNKASPLNFEF